MNAPVIATTIRAMQPASEQSVLVAQLHTLRRRWKVIAAAVLLALAGAVVLLMLLAPKYTARTQILLDPRGLNVMQENPLGAGSLDVGTVESQVTVLQSFNVARRVVQKMKLDQDSEFVAQPGWGLGKLKRMVLGAIGLSDDPPAAPRAGDLTPEQLAAIAAVRKQIAARRVGLTFVLEVSFTSLDAGKAATIGNGIADAYLVDQLEARYEVAQRASSWLSERLGSLREQVQSSERAVAEYRQKHGIVDTSGGTIDKQQVSEISAQLVLARAKTAETRAKFEQAERTAKGGGNIAAVAEVLSSQVVANLRTQEAEVARREADLSTQYGNLHPTIVNVRAELGDIRRAIKNEVDRIITNLRNEYEVAKQREQSLRESLDGLTGVATQNDSARIKLRELEREAEANRALYESFLGKFKETTEQTTLEATDSRIITPAVVPTSPSYPNKVTFLGLALFAGLALGIAAAFLLEFLESGFLTAEQLEEKLDLPVLALLPVLNRSDYDTDGKGATILSYVATNPLSRFSEGVRSARVAVSLSDVDEPPKVMLVTSSVPGEGKSTIASALAASSASSGLKTLLIDADLRHPSSSKLFGLDQSLGLVHLLSGAAEASEAFRTFSNVPLTVLPAGAPTKNSPDLLGSQKMKDLLADVRERYDLVVVDTPPVTAVVDSLVVAPHVDRILFVVEWERTARDIVNRAFSMLGDNRLRVAGVVLNKVDTARMRYRQSYYSYYSYGGKYGYGSYYTGK